MRTVRYHLLLAATALAGRFKYHPDGTPIRRFDYSSRLWLMFAASAATDLTNFSLCDVGSADGTAMRDGALEIGLKGRLVGYDIDKKTLAKGRKISGNDRGPPVTLRTFDGRTIPEPDHSFDVVSFVAVLHHAANNTESLLREAVRVTREWVLVLEDVARPGDPEAAAETKRHDPNGIFRSKAEWEALFARFGLAVVAFGPQFDHRTISHYWVLRLASRRNPCRHHCYRNPYAPKLVINGTIDMPAGARVWALPPGTT